MAGDARSRPAIPAWQRTQQPLAEKSQQEETAQMKEKTETSEVEDAAQQHASPVASLENVTEQASSSEQFPLPAHTPSSPISTSDFETFRNATNSTMPQQTSRLSGPPIITYPEFLVEAHKTPPLITPERIYNTAYVVSGVAAVLYGASKYLVGPMSDSLSAARHEFAAHSLSKVDELNERLSKLVSKVPETQSSLSSDGLIDADETESEASDPAELYHRNIGTQTSPISSRKNSMLAGTSPTSNSGIITTTATENHVNSLNTLNEQLSDLLGWSTDWGIANKTRQDKMNELLAYLDTTMYASPYIASWASADPSGGSRDVEGDDSKTDAVDGLKKEIRAIKGLMLSAKRFPGLLERGSKSTTT